MLWLPRETRMLLQSTAEGLDFKGWVLIICVLPCFCHMAHWGNTANVLVYMLYLCFRESLHLNVSSLQVTGWAADFYLKKKNSIQRQGCSLKLGRYPGTLKIQTRSPFSSVLLYMSPYVWSKGVKGPCVMLRAGLLHWERTKWNWCRPLFQWEHFWAERAVATIFFQYCCIS